MDSHRLLLYTPRRCPLLVLFPVGYPVVFWMQGPAPAVPVGEIQAEVEARVPVVHVVVLDRVERLDTLLDKGGGGIGKPANRSKRW